MNRRYFILAGSAGIAAITFPAYYYFRDIEYDSLLAQPASLLLIWDAGEIREIGNKYRLLKPDEERQNVLVKLLTGGIYAHSPVNVESMAERIKKDFEIGNTILVDGWMLSVTEARQCALFSAAQPE